MRGLGRLANWDPLHVDTNKIIPMALCVGMPSCKRRLCERLGGLIQTACHGGGHKLACADPRFVLMVLALRLFLRQP